MSKHKSGFVYVLANEAMPGILKIGRTTDIHRRLKQLSGASSCPLPFTVAALWYCPSAGVVERVCHHALEGCRVNTRREFFRVEAEEVTALIAWVRSTPSFSDIERIYL